MRASNKIDAEKRCQMATTLHCRASSALASHENAVADLVTSCIELPVGDGSRKLDRVLVNSDCLVAVLDIVCLRIKVNLSMKVIELQ